MNNQQFQFKVDGKIVTIFEDISKLSGADRASLGDRTVHPRGKVYSSEGTGTEALIEAGHHCVKTLSICAICLPAAYWSPRCRLEAWPPLQDDVAVPVDAMELETVLRRVHANTNNLIHGRPLSRVSTAPVCHNVAVRGHPPHQSN